MAFSSGKLAITDKAWFLGADNATHFRYQNSNACRCQVYFGTTAPDASDDTAGETMQPWAVDERSDMSTRGIKAWFRLQTGFSTGAISYERDQ
jgi:hypothetical protein